MSATRGGTGSSATSLTPAWLTIALSGVAWRRWASLATFVVAVVAAMAAALGPLYARGAQESLARQRLLDAPGATTAFTVRASSAGPLDRSPGELVAAVTGVAVDARLNEVYGPVETMIQRGKLSVIVGSRQVGEAPVTWRSAECTAVPVVGGRCPQGPAEVMVSSRTATDTGVGVGDHLSVSVGSTDATRLTVVGVYDQDQPDPRVFVLDTPATAAPPPDAVFGWPTLDELMVDRATAARPGDAQVVAYRRLLAETAPFGAVEAAVGVVGDIEQRSGRGGPVAVTSRLGAVLEEIAPERTLVGSAILAVSLQVAILVWFVLFMVVASATDERSTEVAVAKLRGRRARSTLAFAVAEPLLLTTAAVPVGLALAWLAIRWLAERWFTLGLVPEPDSQVALAAAVALLGGVVACLLAARRALTAPVTDELRKAPARPVVGYVVDAVVLTLTVVSLVQVRGGSAEGLALLAPGLVCLSVALLAVRLLPALAVLAVRRTRGSRRVATFLAVRNVSRRPGGRRLVLLLTVAVGLATFAVDGSAVAARQRELRARVEVGADQVVLLSGGDPGSVLAATRRVDPEGRWAMAGVQLSTSGAPDVLAVDATRLPAVSAWTPESDTLDSVASALTPAAAGPPVVVRGRIEMDVTLRSGRQGTPLTQAEYRPPHVLTPPTSLALQVRRPDGRVSSVGLGALVIGRQHVSAALPQCGVGCSIASLLIHALGPAEGETRTSVRLTALADASGPLDLPTQAGGWRSRPTQTQLVVSDLDPRATVTTHPDGVSVTVRTDFSDVDVLVQPADHPFPLPAVLVGDTSLDSYDGAVAGSFAPNISGATTLVDPLPVRSLLPRVGPRAILVDLPDALAAEPAGTTAGTVMIWLGPAAPPDALDLLRAEGLAVGAVETIAGRSKELAQDGTALAFPYFLLAAIQAVLLAGGALLVIATVGARRRAFELAAVRALGAGRRTVVAASRRELVLLAGAGTVVGALGGLIAARLVLGHLPATSTSVPGSSLPPDTAPAWVAIGLLVVGILAVVVILAQVAAVHVARLAVPDRLREAQA